MIHSCRGGDPAGPGNPSAIRSMLQTPDPGETPVRAEPLLSARGVAKAFGGRRR